MGIQIFRKVFFEGTRWSFQNFQVYWHFLGFPSQKYFENADETSRSSSKKQPCSLKRERCNIDETLIISMQTFAIIIVFNFGKIDVSFMILWRNMVVTMRKHRWFRWKHWKTLLSMVGLLRSLLISGKPCHDDGQAAMIMHSWAKTSMVTARLLWSAQACYENSRSWQKFHGNIHIFVETFGFSGT